MALPLWSWQNRNKIILIPITINLKVFIAIISVGLGFITQPLIGGGVGVEKSKFVTTYGLQALTSYLWIAHFFVKSRPSRRSKGLTPHPPQKGKERRERTTSQTTRGKTAHTNTISHRSRYGWMDFKGHLKIKQSWKKKILFKDSRSYEITRCDYVLMQTCFTI